MPAVCRAIGPAVGRGGRSRPARDGEARVGVRAHRRRRLHVKRLNPDQPSEVIAAPRKLDFGLFESFDDRAGEVRTEHLRGLPLHLPGRILDSRLRFDR